jgi:signal transduction histidine kinase
MDAAARLAGGAAHDFNNLLTAILLNADVLASRLANDAKLRPLAEGILEAAERAADLTKRLLAFSSRQLLDIGEADLGAVLRGMQDDMRRALGDRITLALETGPTRPARADPDRFRDTVLMLLDNARDAMPEGGGVTVAAKDAVLDAKAAGPRDIAPGDYVTVTIADTGAGMTADVAAHAVEPFFTTKERGKGAGLGLSVAYGFARQCGGHLEIETQPGGGTRVTLFFPRD